MIPLNRFLSAAALLAVSLATQSAEKPSAQRHEEPAPKPRETSLPPAGAKIPFQLGKSRPVPILQAKIDGKGPFFFIFDTGASGYVLDEAFVKSLGLELGREQPIGDPSNSTPIVAHEVSLASIELEGATFKGVTAVATDRSCFDAGEDVKGVLGLQLFEDVLFTLDYPAGEIALAKGELPAPGEGADRAGVLAYDAEGPLPRIELALDGKKILAHLDSGAPGGWTFPKSFLEGAKWKEEPKVVGRGRTINGEFEVWSGKIAGTLRLGPIEVLEPEVNFNDRFPFANVGYRALKGYAVTFDQKNHRMRFERKERRAEGQR
jgi:hypothetical protein